MSSQHHRKAASKEWVPHLPISLTKDIIPSPSSSLVIRPQRLPNIGTHLVTLAHVLQKIIINKQTNKEKLGRVVVLSELKSLIMKSVSHIRTPIWALPALLLIQLLLMHAGKQRPEDLGLSYPCGRPGWSQNSLGFCGHLGSKPSKQKISFSTISSLLPCLSRIFSLNECF